MAIFRRLRINLTRMAYAKAIVAYVVFCAILQSNRAKEPPRLDDGQDLSILSTDFHISPIRDLKDILQREADFNRITIVDESLSGRCKMVGTCATKLRVLNPDVGITLGECPNEMKRRFWREYRHDHWMATIDMFICHHAVALCEVYLPFNRPLVIISTTRYELGRHDATSWARLNAALASVASKEFNTVAANSLYDLEYLKHFTGIQNVVLLPSLCAYVDVSYHPRRKEFLIGPSRLSPGGAEIVHGTSGLEASLRASPFSKKLSFKPIRELYPHYSFKDLASHPAIVVIPYQVSIMSLFEYYAMGIPLFVPTLELLVTWQMSHLLLDELSWNCVFNRCDEGSVIEGHPNSPHRGTDPNRIREEGNLRYWLRFADFYQWPGVTYFESWDDLFHKVQHTDFLAISETMQAFRKKQAIHITRTWRDIFRRARATRGSAAVEEESWERSILHSYPEMKHDLLLSKC